MEITNQHITGFVIGVGSAAAGYYLYLKNQEQVDEFLRQQGINVPLSPKPDITNLSLEELMQEKERLEDMIAEKEYTDKKEDNA